MQPDRDFVRQLENLRKEADVIANYVYAEMTIQHAASKSKQLLSRLNETPTFWLTCQAALQTSAYIALGRVFDLKSPYNLAQLLKSIEENVSLFSRAALATRKKASGFTDEERLAEYVAAAHVLTKDTLRSLERSVARHRAVYDRAIMPVRHQYLAHRQAHGESKVQALFARGKLKEFWRLSAYLLRLHDALWNLLHNGRKPNLRLGRYSPKVMFERPTQASGAHERVVRDTKQLMNLLETATPNLPFNRTHNGKAARPRSAQVHHAPHGRAALPPRAG